MTRLLGRLGTALAVFLAASAHADAQQLRPTGAAARPAPVADIGTPNGSFAPVYAAPPGARPVAAPSYGNAAPGRTTPAQATPVSARNEAYYAPEDESVYSQASLNSREYTNAMVGPYSGNACGCGGGTCDSCQSCNSCDPCGVCKEQDCCGCDVRDEKIFRFFTPSDLCCFPSSIMPVTNTTLFEDPRTITGARFIFINQGLPGASAFGGGNFQVYALQARAALTERLSIIATKDGWIDLNPTNTALAGSGFANIAAGLKYNLIRNPETATLLSAGMTFEIPMGAGQVFQGEGDGDFNFFLTGSTELTDRMNWISASGFRIPTNNNEGSQMWWWSNHIDAEIVSNQVYVFGEFNWYHWMSSGQGPIAGFEGGDLVNLGAAGVSGNNIVTAALGPSLKLRDGHIEISAAYEVPLTERRDIIKDRTTVTAVINF